MNEFKLNLIEFNLIEFARFPYRNRGLEGELKL